MDCACQNSLGQQTSGIADSGRLTGKADSRATSIFAYLPNERKLTAPWSRHDGAKNSNRASHLGSRPAFSCGKEDSGNGKP